MGNTLIQTGIRLVDMHDVTQVINTYCKSTQEAKFLYMKIVELDGVLATPEQMMELKGNSDIIFEEGG